MTFNRLIIVLSVVFITASTSSLSYAGPDPKLSREMQTYMKKLSAEVKAVDTNFTKFSATAGEKIFYAKRTHSKKDEERSCTTCHTQDRRASGKTTVGKVIEPISPYVTKGRFSKPKKVTKWFKRNCKWVMERECSAREKGDYITFMFSDK